MTDFLMNELTEPNTDHTVDVPDETTETVKMTNSTTTGVVHMNRAKEFSTTQVALEFLGYLGWFALVVGVCVLCIWYIRKRTKGDEILYEASKFGLETATRDPNTGDLTVQPNDCSRAAAAALVQARHERSAARREYVPLSLSQESRPSINLDNPDLDDFDPFKIQKTKT